MPQLGGVAVLRKSQRKRRLKVKRERERAKTMRAFSRRWPNLNPEKLEERLKLLRYRHLIERTLFGL